MKEPTAKSSIGIIVLLTLILVVAITDNYYSISEDKKQKLKELTEQLRRSKASMGRLVDLVKSKGSFGQGSKRYRCKESFDHIGFTDTVFESNNKYSCVEIYGQTIDGGKKYRCAEEKKNDQKERVL